MADLAHYEGREQAFIKHTLLEKYLREWAYRVGRQWEKLAYVDAFAGPWKTASPDYADSSFAVAITSLKKAQLGLRETFNCEVDMQAVLLATTKAKHAELESYAATARGEGFRVETLRGEFADMIPVILEKLTGDGKKAFRFVFLDPTGWGDIPMHQMADFLQARSCEVLVNLMTSYIHRFLDQDNRAESYHRLFGREGVLEKIRGHHVDFRVEQAVLEYATSLKQQCGFKYVSCAAVLEPDREAVRYYLMFGTNHPKGVQVFKDAEIKAANLQDAVRTEAQARKEGQGVLALDGDGRRTEVVRDLRARFCELARRDVCGVLAASGREAKTNYSKLYCAAMFYPLVTPADLKSWLLALQKREVATLLLGGEKRRTPSPDDSEGDFVTVIDQRMIQALAAGATL